MSVNQLAFNYFPKVTVLYVTKFKRFLPYSLIVGFEKMTILKRVFCFCIHQAMQYDKKLGTIVLNSVLSLKRHVK